MRAVTSRAACFLAGLTLAGSSLALAACDDSSNDGSDAAPPPAPAPSSSAPSGNCYGTFLLASADNGKAVEDNYWSHASGALIDTWGLPANPGANWTWLMRPLGNGSYSVISAVSGMCLDDWGGTQNGASVSQAGCSGSARQAWTFRENGDGTASLVNADNGRCLDDDGSRTDGVSIVTWDCGPWPTQRWHVAKLGVTAFHATAYVISSGMSGKALEVGAAAVDTRSAADAAGTNFEWVLRPVHPGLFQVMNAATGLCLDDDGVTADGTPVAQRACAGVASQEWTIAQTPQGTFTVQSVANGKCLDNGGGSSDGAPALTWACSGLSPQRWWIDPVNGPAPGGARGTTAYDPCGPDDSTPAECAPGGTGGPQCAGAPTGP